MKEEFREEVVKMMEKALEESPDILGLGEYGRGWNDKGTSIRMKMKEVMERWRVNETKGEQDQLSKQKKP